MRSLWQLIYRYHIFLVFLILETLAIALLVRNNNYQRATIVHSANKITGNLYEKRTEIAEYLKLQSINAELAKENARLRTTVGPNYQQLTDNLYMYEDTLYLLRFEYLSGRVINNSVNRPNNFITIDKGSTNGIKKEMGVVAKGSIVGIVKDVSDNFASVMPLINTNMSIGVKLKRSGETGEVSWDGRDPSRAKINYISRSANPLKGDTLITSGFSTYFPEGILVGTIEDFRIPEGENFYTIDILLSTPFHQLNYIEVIHNLLSDEQLELEQRQEGEDGG